MSEQGTRLPTLAATVHETRSGSDPGPTEQMAAGEDPLAQDTAAESTKSARTRERILDAAAKVLTTKGYAGTRLTDIADVAELQAPAIYYYFDGRDDLIREVVLVGMQRTMDVVVSAVRGLPRDASAVDRISAGVAAHLEMVLRESDYASAATRNSGALPPAIREEQQTLFRRYSAFWRTLIDDGVLRGEIREGLDPHIARMLVIGALNWAPEWWDPARGTLDDVVATAVDLVIHGLCAERLPAAQPSTSGVLPHDG